ncbi:mbl domain-containing protein [Cryptosporidium canis]|uniref:ribonuclease Z n=1 Tax=Cryptosporidium canis TaxID=195482 RepID=A0A9D5DJ91_9CRYT|nr:mbl domain-containing protein [Cryptosporidium canis]
MSDAHFQCIGSKHLLSPPSLILTYNGSKCLVNVGENVQRYCFEHKIKLSKLRSIVLTTVSVETVGGLPGLLLTLIGVGVQKLRIVGPEPITQYLLMFGYVIRSQRAHEGYQFTVVSINSSEFLDSMDGIKSDLEIEIIQLTPSSSKPLRIDLDQEVSMECYIGHSFAEPEACLGKESGGSPSFKRRCADSTPFSLYSLSILYLFEFPEKRGKFNPLKAKEFGIPPGPLYSKLKNGESIQLPESRIIHPNDVCSPPIKLPWSIVLHTIDPAELGPVCLALTQILSSKGFVFSETGPENPSRQEIHQELLSNFYVFHFQDYYESLSHSPPSQLEVDQCFIHNRNYLSKGIIRVVTLNQALFSLQENEINPFMTSHFLQEFLGNISPQIFPTSAAKADEIAWNKQFFISPGQKAVQNSNSLINIQKKRSKFHPISQESENQIQSLKREFEAVFSQILENHPNNLFPFLYVLGTGSAIPSPYRNVSGNLLRIDDNTSILLDCGEGSMSQLFTLCKFDQSLFSRIIASIKLVFISHPHEDHFLGLFQLLQLRKLICSARETQETPKRTSQDPQKSRNAREFYFGEQIRDKDFRDLVILGPTKVQKIYNLMQEKIMVNKRKQINSFETSFIAIDQRKQGNSENESNPSLLSDDFFLKLQHFPVQHIRSSFGLKIVIKLNHKAESGMNDSLFTVVFSGDTATPCTSLEAASQECDILIHEATFEDNLSKDAQEKNHSTFSGAIRTASNSSARFLLLTHFSQRSVTNP